MASIITPTLCPSALSSKFMVVLLFGLPGCRNRTVVKHVASQLGLHVVEYSCHDLLASSERKGSSMLAQAFSAARRYAPTILLLHHFDAFSNLSSNDGSQNDQVGMNSEVASIIREFTEPFRQDDDYEDEEEEAEHMNTIKTHPVLLVAAADNSKGLQPTIRHCFSHQMKMGGLTEDQRVEMLSQSLHLIHELVPDTCIEDVVKDMVGQTFSFMPRDIKALGADASSSLIPVNGSSFEKLGDSKEFMVKALERSKKRNASTLGTPKVPNVKWEDVGGLEDVKKSILDTVQLPLLHKDLISSGLCKHSGVLLYGPPDTGKVDELEKTIFVAARDPSLYGIKQVELEKRRKWTTTAPIQVGNIKKAVTVTVSSSNFGGMRQELMRMPKSDQQQDKDRTRTGSYAVVDNDDFISSESDIQMLLIS
ncbi:unnamed protein product [Lactuca saligna]|uniref:ATPase AAA-type core domain-containing protein n=1 Tax=Lactuca saligna TaxID=75948 RepID=A0AA35YEH3_LACSI|nr:unnamed protein product [Lactuca saligna]